MSSTLGIVEARCEGLKGKVARRLGGKPLLDWIVRQVTESQQLDDVVVVAANHVQSSLACDTPLDHDDHAPPIESIDHLVPGNVALFHAASDDVLSTYRSILEDRPADAVVRICADTPFVDPALIDRLVCAAADHAGSDYISYALSNGRPAIFSPVGIFAEWCRAEAVRIADDEAIGRLDRCQPTRFVYSRPDRFAIRLLPAPEGLDRRDLRLTIDSEEDWDHTQAMFDALGPDRMNWHEVAELLNHHPEMRQRMAVLNGDLAASQ